MFGVKEGADFFGKAVSLGFIFELVDDPDDSTPFRAYTKAVDVWAYAGTAELPDHAYTLANLQKDGRCIHNVTKASPAELRRWSIATFGKDGFLHVIAVPTPEWAGIYQLRRYKAVRVESGRRYNVAVSVPPLLSAPPAGAVSSGGKQGFNL